jgi:hypothetical protein
LLGLENFFEKAAPFSLYSASIDNIFEKAAPHSLCSASIISSKEQLPSAITSNHTYHTDFAAFDIKSKIAHR